MKMAVLVFGAFTAALIANPASAFDQNAAQAACGNDVFALCQQAIPNQSRITACLRAHQRQVSPACHQFMAKTAGEMRQSARRKGGRHETVGVSPSD